MEHEGSPEAKVVTGKQADAPEEAEPEGAQADDAKASVEQVAAE